MIVESLLGEIGYKYVDPIRLYTIDMVSHKPIVDRSVYKCAVIRVSPTIYIA